MDKKMTSFKMLLLSTALLLSSCEKNQQEQPVPQIQPVKSLLKSIYWAGWDEWGHKTANCGGWGLCNYVDCWFCNGQPRQAHGGIVKFNPETNEGTLTIELNPSAEDVQAKAIAEKWTFYVDEDIVKENSVLHAGAYEYDESVGSSGGYIIPITIKHE